MTGINRKYVYPVLKPGTGNGGAAGTGAGKGAQSNGGAQTRRLLSQLRSPWSRESSAKVQSSRSQVCTPRLGALPRLLSTHNSCFESHPSHFTLFSTKVQSAGFDNVLSHQPVLISGSFGAMENNFIEHIRHDGHHDTEWGSLKEVAFWISALLVNLGFIIYAAWNLAVRHTDATGSSVLVPMKVEDDTGGQSTALQNARRRGGAKQELPQ